MVNDIVGAQSMKEDMAERPLVDHMVIRLQDQCQDFATSEASSRTSTLRVSEIKVSA